MATRKVTLKLLINKKTKKVLFAEAGKDFVDFLFTLLSFPLGTVIKLLSKNKMVGCLGNLYESIEELSDTFFQPNLGKATVLNPKLPSRPSGSTLLLSDGGENDGTGATRKFYVCENNGYHRNVTDNPLAICSQCNCRMRTQVSFITAPSAAGNDQEGGFVKGVITYMVMDNLEVKPMSTISSITMLNKFNIQEVGALEEKVIELGVDEVAHLSVFWTEGLDLLKASLQSQTVLTSVFLGA
ncbi:unnamed protein product [Linum tenue]|uniref:DUF674 domain-containing protein n=1 Tax=Linum tenue TaxID=586396 RepID=A0AAV0RYW6_9ROSI|nr:unnamed protein product [Linum tenue]